MIRGQKNPNPTKGRKPTGIFSTKGSQKQDGATGPNMALLEHAHAHPQRDKSGSSAQSTRHQAPKRST